MNKETNFEATNCVEEVMENCVSPEKVSSGKLKKSIIGLLLTGATVGTIVTIVCKRKNKGKKKSKKTIEDKMIEKLQKKGYTVYKPLDDNFGDEEYQQ